MKTLSTLVSPITDLLLTCLFCMLTVLAIGQVPGECPEGWYFVEPGGCLLCEEGYILENLEGFPDCFRCVGPTGEPFPPECDGVETALNAYLQLKSNGTQAQPLELDGFIIIEQLPASGQDAGTVQTEILSMQLSGELPLPGPVQQVKVRAGRNFGLPPSSGSITPITPGTAFPKSSTFDVFIEIEIGGLLLRNTEPFRVETKVTKDQKELKYKIDKKEKKKIEVESSDGQKAEVKKFSFTLDDIFQFDEDRMPEFTGYESNYLPEDFRILPNPTAHQFSVQFTSESETNTNVELLDMNGRLIKELFDQKTMPSQIIDIEYDISTFKKGMYYLQYKTGDKIFTQKLIKL